MKKFTLRAAALAALLCLVPLLSAAVPAGKPAAYRASALSFAPAGAGRSFVFTSPVSRKKLAFGGGRAVAPKALPASFAQYEPSCLSNNGPEYLKATANGSTVHVEGYNPALTNIFASSNTTALGVTKHNLFAVTNGAFAFDITMTPPDGSYPLYFGKQKSDGSYEVLYVMLATCRQGAWSFPVSPVYENNLAHIGAITSDTEHRVAISYADIANITALSNRICAGLTDDYGKLRAIHDWVAKNIYYDYDAVAAGTIDANGLNTLKNKRGVCGGYADLYEMLCEAQGLSVYEAIGIAADSADDFPANPQYGHEWNVARVGGRWINIDTTWDTDNKYQNATYTPDEQQDLYFDATDEYFAQEHRIDYITKPDAIVPAFDTPVYSTKAPTAGNVTVTVNVADGTQPVLRHTFTKNGTYTFKATDRFGQFSTTLTVPVNNIDKAKPVIKTSLGSLKSAKGRVTVTVNDPHLAAKAVTRDGRRIPWPDGGSFSATGRYAVTAVDTLGNKATDSFKITG
jgi:Uncharacterized protein involved in cytokinesis, contains TGc (transglutaminase/protease-like) domain